MKQLEIIRMYNYFYNIFIWFNVHVGKKDEMEMFQWQKKMKN